MSKHVLIIGGAGFIGSHLAAELRHYGCRVRALDVLSLQVHGPERKRPDYLAAEGELIIGDSRDPEAVRRALWGIDAVYRPAAVGVGQSQEQLCLAVGQAIRSRRLPCASATFLALAKRFPIPTPACWRFSRRVS